MKLVILLVCFVGAALSKPQPQLGAAAAKITDYAFDNIGLGKYFFSAKSDDGQTRVQQGTLTDEGTKDEALEVEGQYSYVGDDGKTYIVTYTAGKNGYEPYGEHIPQAASVRKTPPQLGIPSAALASLAGK